MNDYISREDVLKAIDYQHEVNNVFESEAAYVQMWETINDDMRIKSADVQPVRYGKWNIKDDHFHSNIIMNYAECSCCGHTCGTTESTHNNYCPNCGADMRGDKE